MPQRYKLPCPACSTTLSVTTTQAGESLTCSCGHSLVAPTLREIRQLDIVDDVEPSTASGAWSPVLGGLFVAGMLLMAIGGIGHWRIEPQRQALNTTRPELQEIEAAQLEELTLERAWSVWEVYRDVTLESRERTPEFLENRAKYRELSIYLYFFWGMVGLGFILIAGSVLARSVSSTLAK